MKQKFEKISLTTENAEEIRGCNVVSKEQRPCREGPNASRTYEQICTFVKRDIRKEQTRAIDT